MFGGQFGQPGNFNNRNGIFAQLSNHSDTTNGRYAIWRDIYRIETFCDLKKINKYQIQSIGVKKIEVSEYCTCCDNDKFFSYRKENGTTSRHSVVVKLK